MRVRKQLQLMTELAITNARASELAWEFLARFQSMQADFGLEEALQWYAAEVPGLLAEMDPISEKQHDLLDALGR